MPDQHPPKENPVPVKLSRKQWQEMERFRKGETKGDVALLPPELAPQIKQSPPR